MIINKNIKIIIDNVKRLYYNLINQGEIRKGVNKMRQGIKGNPVNLMMLKSYINGACGSGRIKKKWLVTMLDTTYVTLRNKINGKTEITLWEAQQIATALGLTREERDAVFFGDKF